MPAAAAVPATSPDGRYASRARRQRSTALPITKKGTCLSSKSCWRHACTVLGRYICTACVCTTKSLGAQEYVCGTKSFVPQQYLFVIEVLLEARLRVPEGGGPVGAKHARRLRAAPHLANGRERQKAHA
jgi:hypothetical protein